MKANFGILPPLAMEPRMSKSKRAFHYVNRAQRDLEAYRASEGL